MNTHIKLITALVCVGLGIGGTPRPATAQFSRVELRQIIDQAFETALSRKDSLSRIPISKRNIAFDLARTMTAFGQTNGGSLVDLALRTPVSEASKSSLNDCDTWNTQACSGLGWKAYAWLEPVSVSANSAVVRLQVQWPDRGRAAYEPGVAPTGKASLVGMAVELEFARASTGEWKFVTRRSTIAGD